MAHVKIDRNPDGTTRLLVNDVDMSLEVYAHGVELTTTGDREFDEIALRLTMALSSLTINGERIAVAGQFDEAAEKVREATYSEVLDGPR